MSEQSVLEALQAWLYRTPIRGSGPQDADDDQVVEGFVHDYLERITQLHERQAREQAVIMRTKVDFQTMDTEAPD